MGRNCEMATFLIEKKQIGNIGMREELDLQLHLAACSMCRLFQEQSKLINQLVQGLTQSPRLDELFKAQMHGLIMSELKKIN